MSLNVCEIFYSLQGESTFMGRACVFVRLAGCNLNCTWCDTLYARTESRCRPIDEIIAQVDGFNCPLVEITGGEPLLQESTPELISRLIEKGYRVLLETNGSLDISPVDPACVRIVDIKPPSSGEQDSFFKKNIARLTARDEVKFVIGSRQDYEFARNIILTELEPITADKIHLSPVSGGITPADLAGWMLTDHLKARLSMQQHKIIWDPDLRGV